MALTIKHTKVSTIPDGTDPSLVLPSDWNADHALSGVASIAQGGTNATTAAAARTSLGVPATDGTGATGSWAINITGTAEKATNIASGAGSENRIPVQAAPSVTNFIAAPTASGQVLSYDGTNIAWAAGGGGGGNVNSIIAGTNITIDPPSGQGNVTINATGGTSLLGQTQSVSPFETALGFEAGNANTGVNNTYLGYQAGRLMTGATNNVVLGYQALDACTIPASSVVIGATACGATTNINNCVVIGQNAAGTTTALGVDNTLIGQDTGRTLTGGSNIFIGAGCGNSATTITTSVAIGNGSLGIATSGSAGTVAVGHNALGSLTSGLGNTGVGFLAGTLITTGTSNTCIGYETGKATTTNSLNTMLGFRAGLVTTGGTNTFVGANVGNIITSGFGNTLIGVGAANNITTGSNNTVIGNGLLPAVGSNNMVALFDGVGDLAVMFNDPGAMTFDGTNYGAVGDVLVSRGTTNHPLWTNPNVKAVSTVTGSTSLLPTVSVYFVNCTSANITCTLPNAAGNLGLAITVKRVDLAAGNTLTVASAGGTIEGLATQQLGVSVAVQYCSDGTNWWELANS